MTGHQSKRRAARVLAGLSLPALAVSGLAVTAPAASAAPRLPAGHAVVALRGATLVRVPGVTVDQVFPAIHSELVHGSSAALQRLAADPGVVGVMADKKVAPTSNDNEGRSNGQTKSVYSWQGLGHEAGRSGAGAGVHVALIDTGVSDSDVLNRASGHVVDAIDTSGLVSGGTVSTTGPFTDGYGHGTFMASLIAGGGQTSGRRTVGVAPGAIVDVVKVAGADGQSSFGAMMAGLNWVATNAATEQVANLSFGLAPDEVGGYGQDPFNLAVETLRSLGTNVVVSAGNTAGEVTDPGFDPHVITVGAAETRGWWAKKADFSGSGVVAGVQKPDLMGSGVGLLGVLPAGSAIAVANPASLQPNGFYRGSGTSEATAVVSGIAAILVADFPGVTTDQVKASLRTSATPMFADGTGAGLANVVNRLARSRDDWRMGDGGALGEATFDSSAWGVNGWGAALWGSSAWDSSAKWGSAKWSGQAWAALSFFDSAKWSSASWGSAKWSSAKWSSAKWGSASWGSASWGSASWGSASWGSDFWGDGGDAS